MFLEQDRCDARRRQGAMLKATVIAAMNTAGRAAVLKDAQNHLMFFRFLQGDFSAAPKRIRQIAARLIDDTAITDFRRETRYGQTAVAFGTDGYIGFIDQKSGDIVVIVVAAVVFAGHSQQTAADEDHFCHFSPRSPNSNRSKARKASSLLPR